MEKSKKGTLILETVKLIFEYNFRDKEKKSLEIKSFIVAFIVIFPICTLIPFAIDEYAFKSKEYLTFIQEALTGICGVFISSYIKITRRACDYEEAWKAGADYSKVDSAIKQLDNLKDTLNNYNNEKQDAINTIKSELHYIQKKSG